MNHSNDAIIGIIFLFMLLLTLFVMFENQIDDVRKKFSIVNNRDGTIQIWESYFFGFRTKPMANQKLFNSIDEAELFILELLSERYDKKHIAHRTAKTIEI